MGDVLKSGSSGDGVRGLQENLRRLGYDVVADGKFGPATEQAVMHLQKSFGYDVDGKAGDGTMFLVTQQLGLNWNARGTASANATTGEAGSTKDAGGAGGMKGGGAGGKLG